jgi:hypothetical protein
MNILPPVRCECCDEDVENYEYIDELKMCRYCYEEENGGGFVSIDQAETTIGDR